SLFFFQAEDGIRDFHVTGVQTCALPICLIVRMTGELDLRTAELFRSEVRRAWEAPPRPRHLILDLRGLTFIDSAGVGAILARCRDVGHSTAGRVVAFGTRPHVHRTLAMAGAWRVMH